MDIKNYIHNINSKGEKALAVFLTVGFPTNNAFLEIAEKILSSYADILELGIPFSDPLADGPTIQYSSMKAIENEANAEIAFECSLKLKSKIDKPLILMCYANTIVSYNKKKFFARAIDSGVDGIIVPDVPLEESEEFFQDCDSKIQKILLCSPTTENERIKKIDQKSEGFVYCVSVTGSTGERSAYSSEVLKRLQNMRSNIVRNKALIGFGINGPDSVKQIKDFCDGVIVGSAVIRKIIESNGNYEKVIKFVESLKKAAME